MGTLIFCCASVILSPHNASEKMSVMGEKTITMSRKEVKRLAVIQRLLHQQITTREAAVLLGLSVRQVYRIKARVLQEGEEGIVHKNRGRKPAHALSEDLRHTIGSCTKANGIKDPTTITLLNCWRSTRASGSALPPCGESCAPPGSDRHANAVPPKPIVPGRENRKPACWFTSMPAPMPGLKTGESLACC